MLLIYYFFLNNITFCIRITVVTGSTDGIGKEYAKELAKRNINIVLISRSIDKLLATKNEINSLNPNIEVKIIQADFSKGKDEIEKIDGMLKDIPVGILGKTY